MLTMADIGEVGFLKQLQRALPQVGRGLAAGIGDDAAALRGLSPLAVLSCDMLIEDVDFKRAWASPRDIGHKAAAVNLSDLAAMGAEPRALLAAVALRPEQPVREVLAMLRALHATGMRFGAPLIGGDISKTSGPCVISVTAIGRTGTLALRRGAGRLGDVVMVSGTLGEAALGLRLLEGGARTPASIVRRQLRPEPQVALGQALAGQKLARAGADVSDGLAKDALHVVPAHLGVQLDVQTLPLTRRFCRVAAHMQLDPCDLALSGGEDFELVLAVPPAKVQAAQKAARAVGTQLTAIGKVIGRQGLHLNGRESKSQAGFDHFLNF